jgi:hypothetical protein
VAGPKFSLARPDPEMDDLIGRTDHKTLARWAVDCAKRVLPYFETAFPEDPRPRNALATLRTWIKTGEFHMAVIRKASLDAHAAAREVGEDNPARSAARAAGQAVATVHVRTHAPGAALYARQAVHRAAVPSRSEAAVARERDWQVRRLINRREKSKDSPIRAFPEKFHWD